MTWFSQVTASRCDAVWLFESTQLNALGRVLRNRRKRIRAVQRRLLDHHSIVKAHGSFSLKAVVPALVPRLGYREVGDGQEAGAAYVQMIDPATDPVRRAAIDRELRRYCGTDTLATFGVWKALRRRAATVR